MKLYRPEKVPVREFEEVLFGRGHRDVNDRGGYVHVEEDGVGGDVIVDLFKKWVFPEVCETYRVRISVREGAILVERING
jgi:hypothetical protein